MQKSIFQVSPSRINIFTLWINIWRYILGNIRAMSLCRYDYPADIHCIANANHVYSECLQYLSSRYVLHNKLIYLKVPFPATFFPTLYSKYVHLYLFTHVHSRYRYSYKWGYFILLVFFYK